MAHSFKKPKHLVHFIDKPLKVRQIFKKRQNSLQMSMTELIVSPEMAHSFKKSKHFTHFIDKPLKVRQIFKKGQNNPQKPWQN